MSPSQDQIYQVISQRYKTLEESDTVTQTLRHQLQCTIVLLNQINYKTSRPYRKILKDPFTGLLAITSCVIQDHSQTHQLLLSALF